MMTSGVPDIERHWDALAEAGPVLTPEKQRAAITLYRELAKGDPVGVEQLAAALRIPALKAEELLQRPPIRP